MKTPAWLTLICLAAALPIQAETFKPIELKDQELANLRGRYVMPGRIISFGVVMTSTWQNASGDVIGAKTSMQVQQSTIKPQFYVSMIDKKGSGSGNAQGTGSVTGGAGLNTTDGVTQVVRAAGDNNTAYNNVDINVTKANQAPDTPQQGQVLAAGSTLVGSNGAGSLSVSASGTGVQLDVVANNNQGSALQRIAQGGLMQNATLLGNGNQVSNLTSLNVVLRDNVPDAALNGNLDQLKGLRALGY
ncbi:MULTISPECIES: hypothetical protein [Pseudomonas]|jgi:hypothetical protein|uniref:Fap system outer membrane protein n=1 Tax=Pseudomonas soli TaxID=1306993 RepID=A0A1H9QEC6_9PSED|nr:MULTISPECIES: hypothetical protein [Pseudomonas]AUY31710.1 hypothetical protein C3F42_00040 [Pseudomonas sp. PONIH3]MCX5509736.1 hypothetical protein [Pseudomonas sp. BJa3]MDT3717359.1 hypothetical protein [Pseudomonas soli]MDT3734091.1 hypothetical protein [Pseudomonas soli]MEE1881643.1 hypothetical protein [Pseudomonas soli]